MKTHQMYFREADFKKNTTNVTIRRGKKWNFLIPGDRLSLLEVGTSIELAEGIVKEVMYGSFDTLPEYILESNQEDIFSMYDGFNKFELVTVIMFEVI